MAYSTEAIKRDMNGDPIPQYFDEETDEFLPLTEIHVVGRVLEYMWFEGDAEPDPGAGNRAVGLYVSATDVWSIKHWDGAAWGDPA